jgi:hypothetical protein
MTDHERAAKAERLLAAIREYALVRVRDGDPDPGWRSILALATPLPEQLRDAPRDAVSGTSA